MKARNLNTSARGRLMICVVAICGLICAVSGQADAGLVARYSFDSNFKDSSGYGFDATTTRAPIFNTIDAKFGASADFERDDRLFLEVAHNSVFLALEDMTIAAWLKPESWSESARILQKGDNGVWGLHAEKDNFD